MAQYPKDPAVCAGCSGCDDALAAIDDAAWESWVHETDWTGTADYTAMVAKGLDLAPVTPVVRYVSDGPCRSHRIVGCPCVGPIASND